MKRRMKRLSALLAAAAMTVSLTACGNTASTETERVEESADNAGAETNGQDGTAKAENDKAASGEQKTITIAWTNIMDSQQQIWEKYIFAPFLEKHPEVEIDFQCLPDLQNTVRVQVAAGAGPDMFYMDSIDIPDYASTGRILNLEKYREQYGLDDQMFDWAIRSCLYQEQMYALPASATSYSGHF